MSVLDLLFGRPLANEDEEHQRVGVVAGIPMLGLDALASAAYGPEAALTILLPLGLLGINAITPLVAIIIVLLGIVFLSYRQTITAYPNGGGSYTVAHENLGVIPGLIAAAALLLDYILVVAVGISAGVGALVSAIPKLQPYMLPLCLLILGLITIVNLRGVRESGLAFVIPTYLFIACMLIILAMGAYFVIMSGGKPIAKIAPAPQPSTMTTLSWWLLIQAFASGCTAMTGVEAVSNGVSAFRQPATHYARRTLTIIIGTLMVMLAGIAWLAKSYQIGATEPGKAGYQSVLSQLVAAVSGQGILYTLTIGSTLAVLALSANTGFADFPRLCRILAHDHFLPHAFASRGRRLVYSIGIIVLASFAGIILIIFGGITDHLIPLFAVGAFLAFTLSQTGMVLHWFKHGGLNARRNMLINGVGAVSTGITLIVILVAKFATGAWITLVILPALVGLFLAVRRHYQQVAQQVQLNIALDTSNLTAPIVVIPFGGWNKMAHKALRFALKISPDIYAVQISTAEEAATKREQWEQIVLKPIQEAGLAQPHFELIESPYRQLFGPLMRFILDLREANPNRQIAVIISELAENRWYYYLLHKQRGMVLKARLFFGGNAQIIVINVPWYLEH
ncbi:MAG TPA: APC family permease [Herpetosiphon sp.]|uniref:Amino acid permease-associated region n=1 Tax=Herpetosiphon aurantiacus (strain ATCC 23779 / DSM 785 / 114-95) TaxID=316274 RepID=A9B497_HERA2|nr:APC family permease [Herpetosiphon sp.]ABX02654.1 conserved hypothetical protein [Herpetosiphon aurantiacus DSM 785]HBW49592.1 APC family permease [Herpetosiphon sp.]